MSAYQYFYRVVAVLLTLLAAWFALIGLASGNWLQVGISLFVCFLLGFGAFKAGKGNKRDIAIASSVPALIALPLVNRLFQRAAFILENGGMERVDGFGSPLAFLIGFTFELVFLIPLLGLFLAGVYLVCRKTTASQ